MTAIATRGGPAAMARLAAECAIPDPPAALRSVLDTARRDIGTGTPPALDCLAAPLRDLAAVRAGVLECRMEARAGAALVLTWVRRVAALIAAPPGPEELVEKAAALADTLADMPAEAFTSRTAASAALAGGKWFPSLAEINRVLAAAVAPLQAEASAARYLANLPPARPAPPPPTELEIARNRQAVRERERQAIENDPLRRPPAPDVTIRGHALALHRAMARVPYGIPGAGNGSPAAPGDVGGRDGAEA